mmetsp:Transcript_24296/g.61862  ORF Transcript_24296/g.61862 Transcript_24296/m.61862 type:complete len:265 (-) Transcript_24296:796-1590(-)
MKILMEVLQFSNPLRNSFSGLAQLCQSAGVAVQHKQRRPRHILHPELRPRRRRSPRGPRPVVHSPGDHLDTHWRQVTVRRRASELGISLGGLNQRLLDGLGRQAPVAGLGNIRCSQAENPALLARLAKRHEIVPGQDRFELVVQLTQGGPGFVKWGLLDQLHGAMYLRGQRGKRDCQDSSPRSVHLLTQPGLRRGGRRRVGHLVNAGQPQQEGTQHGGLVGGQGDHQQPGLAFPPLQPACNPSVPQRFSYHRIILVQPLLHSTD